MRLLLLLLLAAFASALAALAQALPNHVDPGARETAPDLSAIPAIRFLTSNDYPPFNYRDNKDQLVGFNVDLARAICAEIKVACTLQAWPWEQAADALADNQGDALIAGLAIDPQTAARFDFSDVYLEFPARFVTGTDAVAGFDATKLGGKTIAVRRGTAHANFLERYLPNARRAEFDTEFAALAAVKDGTADAYFGDALRASFWLNQNPDCCGFAGDPYFRPDLFGEGLAVAVAAGHDAIRNALDYALLRLKRDGTLDQLYLRWFPVSFY